MSKRTPGQWIVQTPMTGDDLVIEARPSLEYHELARVRAPQYGQGAAFDEMRANARLMAAAPELLEALTQIAALENTEQNEWDAVERLIPEMCQIAKAVIAKATGAA